MLDHSVEEPTYDHGCQSIANMIDGVVIRQKTFVFVGEKHAYELHPCK